MILVKYGKWLHAWNNINTTKTVKAQLCVHIMGYIENSCPCFWLCSEPRSIFLDTMACVIMSPKWSMWGLHYPVHAWIVTEVSICGKQVNWNIKACAWPRTHFTEDYTLTIKIWWKFHFSWNQIQKMCVNICCNLLTYSGIIEKLIFPQIWSLSDDSSEIFFSSTFEYKAITWTNLDFFFIRSVPWSIT